MIIYSSLHKEKSNQHQHILIDIVKQNYPSNKIAFLCGEDDHLPHYLTPVCLYPEYTRNGHICFVREL
jgi:hypothetical protein